MVSEKRIAYFVQFFSRYHLQQNVYRCWLFRISSFRTAWELWGAHISWLRNREMEILISWNTIPHFLRKLTLQDDCFSYRTLSHALYNSLPLDLSNFLALSNPHALCNSLFLALSNFLSGSLSHSLILTPLSFSFFLSLFLIIFLSLYPCLYLSLSLSLIPFLSLRCSRFRTIFRLYSLHTSSAIFRFFLSPLYGPLHSQTLSIMSVGTHCTGWSVPRNISCATRHTHYSSPPFGPSSFIHLKGSRKSIHNENDKTFIEREQLRKNEEFGECWSERNAEIFRRE